jgi:glycosyltransferase involved in cell wall biosynthesis
MVAPVASMQDSHRRCRLLVFIVAYNAERTIEKVVHRLPSTLAEYDTEILIIDDSSRDRTFEEAYRLEAAGQLPFPLTVLYNPVNQGYGGNQKIGFHYAIDKGFDVVALVHGDGQYAPEALPELVQPLLRGEADAVFGSRMMTRTGALKGGMPLYKYAGNKILTTFQNWLLGSSLSEFHSGYRLYSVRALERIPFDRNTNDFHFDTEIIIQLFRAHLRVKELPIPTFYGDEICHVNGFKYALDVVKATTLARVQDLGIFYERKFDVTPAESHPEHPPKLTFESPQTMALARVPAGSKVAVIGPALESIAEPLRGKDCRITGVDSAESDLDRSGFPLDAGSFDYVLLLDIVEHLRSPENFLDSLRASRVGEAPVKLIVSTANIGFFVTRMALLLGWFHYGRRGILDLTHTRLFTFATAKALFEQYGYRVEEVRGVPAPFPLALGDGRLARLALAINKALIRISKSLFSYQIFMVCTPLPPLPWLLARAFEARNEKVEGVVR